jgi:hypothetical protein
MPAYGQLWLGSTTGWNSPPATCSMPRARQIPEAMIGRLLNDGDQRRLHRILITKKPPAPRFAACGRDECSEAVTARRFVRSFL